MKTMRHIPIWLLITLLTLSANGDVWGKRLETNWNGNEVSESQTQGNQRGYTDHEHLDSIGLIHMNGRVYDPKLARFISPDPYIQDPYNTQSFNRYSYVWNNPLRHTDPTGEFIPLIIAGIKIAGLAYGVYEAAEVARGIATGEITGQEAVTGAVITAGIGVVGGAIVKLANKVTPPVVEEQIKDVVDKALRKNTDAQQNLSDKPTRTADAPDGRGGNNDVEVNDNVNGDATKGGDEAVDVFRVFGGDARAQGFSFTTVDPRKVKNFRDGAGLPSGGASGATNSADFLIKGTANTKDIIKSRSALPLDGNKGGLPELIIDSKNVKITDFSVIKP